MITSLIAKLTAALGVHSTQKGIRPSQTRRTHRPGFERLEDRLNPTPGGHGAACFAISVDKPTVTEGDTLTFIVQRTGELASSCTVYLAVSGTAKAGRNFIANSKLTKPLVFNSAQQTTQTIVVQTVENFNYNENANLTVTVKSVVGDATIIGAVATTTIADNGIEVQPSTYSIDPARNVTEGKTTFFTVRRFGDLTKAQTVTFDINNGAVDPTTDYTFDPPTKTLFFDAFVATQSIAITAIDDNLYELKKEPFTIMLTSVDNEGRLQVGKTAGVCTILDNDKMPKVSVDIGAVVDLREGAAPFEVTVTLSNPTYEAANVFVTLSGVGATAQAGASGDASVDGGDLAFGQLLFQPGETSKSFFINVRDDQIIEAKEQFKLRFTNGLGLAPGAKQPVVNVFDNDVPAFAIGNVSVAEGNGNTTATLLIQLVGFTTETKREVRFHTIDGTAIAGVDYVKIVSGKATIGPSSTSVAITVTIKGDKVKDTLLTKSFLVALAPHTSYTLTAENRGEVTINDDD